MGHSTLTVHTWLRSA